MRRKHPRAWGKLLLADLDETAAGGGVTGDLCADAARRMRAQDLRIIALQKQLTRWKKRQERQPT